jgi:hypothetical protein
MTAAEPRVAPDAGRRDDEPARNRPKGIDVMTPSQRNSSRNWLVLSAAWAIMGGLMLLEAFPIRPRTSLGWALFVVAGPLLWLAAEAFGTLLEREPVGRWTERMDARAQSSGRRP